jgi:hypothetical protein
MGFLWLPKRAGPSLHLHDNTGLPAPLSGGTSGEARSEGGLDKMTRRKREIIGLRNERDFPHLVELALPPEGFRDVFLQIDAFHRERHIPVRWGRSRHEVKPFYIRFCFPDTGIADAFRIALVVSA